MAASEHSRSLKLGLAEWPLSGNRYFRKGSRRDRPPFGFIAGKRSVKFRFPEAAIGDFTLTANCGYRSLEKPTSTNDGVEKYLSWPHRSISVRRIWI